jgi:ligand-binding SRPBCC domain-containing protein
MRFCLSTFVGHPDPRAVLARFDERLFRALAPPFPRLRIDEFGGSQPGAVVAVTMDWGLLRQPWVSRITAAGDSATEAWFVDEGEQLPWPFRQWRHRHVVRADPARGGCLIIDDLTYHTGSPLLDWLARPALWALLAYRKPIYRRWLAA